MSYKATVYNIMISGPKDVKNEIDAAIKLVEEWNKLHSEKRKISLNALHWNTHYVPDAREFPQDGINNQIVNKSDALFAIFKHRIGSCTGKYPSGTCEEIDIALQHKIPVMIYFSSEKLPQDIDMEQWNKLCVYGKSLEAKPDRTGRSYSRYDNLEHLREQLRLAIEKVVDLPVRCEIIVPMTNPADQLVASLSLSREAKLVLLSAIIGDGFIRVSPNDRTITSGGITFSNYDLTREVIEELKNGKFITTIEGTEPEIFSVASEYKKE